MKAFRVSGEFKMGRGWQPFTLETLAESEDEAREWTLSILGSKHRVNRRQIEIQDIHAEDPSEVEDASIRFGLEHEEEYKERKAEETHV